MGSGQQRTQFFKPFQGAFFVVRNEVNGFAHKTGMFENDGEAVIFLLDAIHVFFY
jgi:hypothetical protein